MKHEHKEERTMTTKVTWVVMKNETEISRHATKKMADVVAHEIGGYVLRQTAC